VVHQREGSLKRTSAEEPSVSSSKRGFCSSGPDKSCERSGSRSGRGVHQSCYLVLLLQNEVANLVALRLVLLFSARQFDHCTYCAPPLRKSCATVAALDFQIKTGISFCDLGPDKRIKLGGWVDSDFESDIDSRKSMTGYLMQ
jgi:hypothetical protein